jgi:hypothetical protein
MLLKGDMHGQHRHQCDVCNHGDKGSSMSGTSQAFDQNPTPIKTEEEAKEEKSS